VCAKVFIAFSFWACWSSCLSWRLFANTVSQCERHAIAKNAQIVLLISLYKKLYMNYPSLRQVLSGTTKKEIVFQMNS